LHKLELGVILRRYFKDFVKEIALLFLDQVPDAQILLCIFTPILATADDVIARDSLDNITLIAMFAHFKICFSIHLEKLLVQQVLVEGVSISLLLLLLGGFNLKNGLKDLVLEINFLVLQHYDSFI
jgi:hypothetical protein